MILNPRPPQYEPPMNADERRSKLGQITEKIIGRVDP
jgi:hypothetical protein